MKLISMFWMQPKDYSIKMNKKERRLATATALQSAAQSITVVDDIKVSQQSIRAFLYKAGRFRKSASLNPLFWLLVF